MTLTREKTWSGPNRTGETQINMVDKIGRRLLSVTRTVELAPHYRRIYLTGDALKDDGFPYVRFAPADHVKVYFPPAGSTEVALPVRGEGGWAPEADGSKPHFRDYTPRGFDPATAELILEFSTLGPGRASQWGRDARPGSQLGVMGPRANVIYPENYSHYFLAGDETALPALARFIEELPEGATARVIAEVASAEEQIELPQHERVELSWVHRDSRGGLADAVLVEPLPGGEDWFMFAAGEARALKVLREQFRVKLGLPRERVVMDGYWMRGVDELDRRALKLNA